MSRLGERRGPASTNPYAVVGPGEPTPPKYDRVTASLSDREIEAELATEQGRTDKGWRKALLAERRERQRRKR